MDTKIVKIKNKGGNPNWVPGVSGNPAGRRPSHFGRYLREHPSVPLVLEKILAAALDDNDPRQKDAWKIVVNKVAPDLKAQEIKTDIQSHIGVIMMPVKVPIESSNGNGRLLGDEIDAEVPKDNKDHVREGEDAAQLDLLKAPTPTPPPSPYNEGGVRDSRLNYSLREEVAQETTTDVFYTFMVPVANI